MFIGANIRVSTSRPLTFDPPHVAMPRAARLLRAVLARASSPAELCARALDALGVTIYVAGELPSTPSIIVANHLGALDPLVIVSLTGAGAIAKSEIGNWPGLGNMLARNGALFVRRGDPVSGAVVLRQADRMLHQGRSVLCFPEGTSTNGEPPRPFAPGMFALAAMRGLPVVPIALRFAHPWAHWYGDQPFVPHMIELLQRGAGSVRVTFGAPLHARKSEKAKDFAARARAIVSDAFLSH